MVLLEGLLLVSQENGVETFLYLLHSCVCMYSWGMHSLKNGEINTQ